MSHATGSKVIVRAVRGHYIPHMLPISTRIYGLSWPNFYDVPVYNLSLESWAPPFTGGELVGKAHRFGRLASSFLGIRLRAKKETCKKPPSLPEKRDRVAMAVTADARSEPKSRKEKRERSLSLCVS